MSDEASPICRGRALKEEPSIDFLWLRPERVCGLAHSFGGDDVLLGAGLLLFLHFVEPLLRLELMEP